MKPLNLFGKVCSFILLMSLALSCTNDEPVTMDSFENELSNKVIMDKLNYPIYLEGNTFFPSYAVKEGRDIIEMNDFVLPTTATLIWESGQNYIMELQAGNLTAVCELKITPAGVVSYTWPETYKINGVEVPFGVIDLIYYHDGVHIYGPGVNKGTVNFKGTFDGTNFYAKAHFMGKQLDGDTGSLPWYSESIDGPIMIDFGLLELEVVPN